MGPSIRGLCSIWIVVATYFPFFVTAVYWGTTYTVMAFVLQQSGSEPGIRCNELEPGDVYHHRRLCIDG